MEYLCPMYESTQFVCGRPALYLVAGTAVCDYHARQYGLTTRTQEDIYVVFDGAPGPESPRFVEVETAAGRSITVNWQAHPTEGLHRLGPFHIPQGG